MVRFILLSLAIVSKDGSGCSYDAKNELIGAKHSASIGGAIDKEVDFKYDVFGNRVEQDVDSDGAGPLAAQVTKFALDGWKNFNGTAVGNENWDVWADLNANNTLQTRYLRGDVVDQLFAQIGSDGSASWYLTDRLGSVRTVLDSAGVVKDRVSYDGFGKVVVETAAQYRGRFGWTGREFVAEVGLQYNRARYYDPHSGRWMSQDPLGFAAGDSNLYRYIGNATTGATDPSGLYKWPWEADASWS